MAADVKVTIDKDGGNKMEYKRRVPDFNTFIKSPDKFTKGQSVKTSADGVTSKPGDKDYKALLAKVKMFSEQLEAETDLTKIGAISAELAQVNEELAVAIKESIESVEAAAAAVSPDAKKKVEDSLGAAIEKFLNGEPSKAEALKVELQKVGDTPEKVQATVQAEAEKNAPEAQKIIDAVQGADTANTKVVEALGLVLEAEVVAAKQIKPWISKFVDKVLGSAAGLGTLAYGISAILQEMTNGDINVMVQMIGEVGGIAALVGLASLGVKTAVDNWHGDKK